MSTPDLQSQITQLAVRLAALDGQGMPDTSTSFVAKTNAEIAGLKTDLQQSVLTLDGLLTTLTNTVNNLWAALSTSLGITPPATPTTGSVIPPSGS